MTFNTDLEKFSYAIGLSLASNMLQSGIKTIDVENVCEAVRDVYTGKMPKIQPQEANQVIETFFKAQQADLSEKNVKEGKDFLEKNKKTEGVTTTESGLQYKILKEGTGSLPKATDKVKCHYHGTLVNGEIFDSSIQRGQPAEFPVNQVIKGWVEALQMMPVGSKWQLVIPPELGYGEQGAGGAIGPNATLIFDIELIDIV